MANISTGKIKDFANLKWCDYFSTPITRSGKKRLPQMEIKPGGLYECQNDFVE